MFNRINILSIYCVLCGSEQTPNYLPGCCTDNSCVYIAEVGYFKKRKEYLDMSKKIISENDIEILKIRENNAIKDMEKDSMENNLNSRMVSDIPIDEFIYLGDADSIDENLDGDTIIEGLLPFKTRQSLPVDSLPVILLADDGRWASIQADIQQVRFIGTIDYDLNYRIELRPYAWNGFKLKPEQIQGRKVLIDPIKLEEQIVKSKY